MTAVLRLGKFSLQSRLNEYHKQSNEVWPVQKYDRLPLGMHIMTFLLCILFYFNIILELRMTILTNIKYMINIYAVVTICI